MHRGKVVLLGEEQGLGVVVVEQKVMRADEHLHLRVITYEVVDHVGYGSAVRPVGENVHTHAGGQGIAQRTQHGLVPGELPVRIPGILPHKVHFHLGGDVNPDEAYELATEFNVAKRTIQRRLAKLAANNRSSEDVDDQRA